MHTTGKAIDILSVRRRHSQRHLLVGPGGGFSSRGFNLAREKVKVLPSEGVCGRHMLEIRDPFQWLPRVQFNRRNASISIFTHLSFCIKGASLYIHINFNSPSSSHSASCSFSSSSLGLLSHLIHPDGCPLV